MSGRIWLDGRLVEPGEARVSVADLAVRHGASAFETMLALHGRVFRLGQHLARLRLGLEGMGIQPPAEERLREAIDAALAGAVDPAAVRVQVTAGPAAVPDLAAAGPPSIVVEVREAGRVSEPPRLRISSIRVDEQRPLRGAKLGNYLPYLLARAEARRAGADDALLLNRRGDVCEGASANFFAVIAGQLVTPDLDSGPLPGITRAVVIECARRLGIEVRESSLPPGSLWDAGEAFLTSSVAGVQAVRAIVGEQDGARREWEGARVPGIWTARIAGAYEELLHAETEASTRAAGSAGEGDRDAAERSR